MSQPKELKEYINSNFTSSQLYLSIVHDQIRYIYEAPTDVVISDASTHTAALIGICARGTFYALTDKYRSAGKNLLQELSAFEQLYNTAFDKQMKRYSAQNPIGGKVSVMLEKRLDGFRENDMERVALDLIFGADDLTEKPVDHSYFEPLFLRYLLLGSKSLDDAVKADINERADELNFTMMSEDMAYKRVAELLQDEKMPEKIALYGKIRQSKSSIFTAAINFEGIVINNIDIEKAQLMRMIKYGEAFTYKGKLMICFDDITEISDGKRAIYGK